jgi:hypothetical protein
MQTTRMSSSSRLSASAFLATLLLLGACKSQETAEASAAPPAASSTAPSRASITNEVTATAQVVAVDAGTRMVTLRREDGSTMQVKAGEAVRNFAQIAVGDTLKVKYQEKLEASLRPKGEPAQAASAVAAAARAEAGAKPGGGVGVGISVRVRVESLDRENNIVTFSLSTGELVSRRVATPEGREFVKGLKLGDTVQLDYSETLAISIDKL